MFENVFGRLTVNDFIHDPIQNGAVISGALGGLALVLLITYLKRWKWLWNEWITTVDPKRIGIMYITVVLVMFMKGFTDAMMMRLQQATSVGDSYGFLTSHHFQ